jgi:hypothetical protein
MVRRSKIEGDDGCFGRHLLEMMEQELPTMKKGGREDFKNREILYCFYVEITILLTIVFSEPS